MQENNNLKPMLNIDELINNLKEKNIKFNKMTEEEVKLYLKTNNNYYNVTSYKNNFERYMYNGKFVDKYIDLDFAYLKDMADIDYKVRVLLFKMIINIEHSLKLKILDIIENIDDEDGYNIVNLFLEEDFNNEKFPKKVHNSILKKVGNIYHQKIFDKYDIDNDKKLENIPVWELLEIITFGELVNFYDYLTKYYNLRKENKDVYIYRDIVKLRNAVFHNTNILNDLVIKDNNYQIPYSIIGYLNETKITKKIRNKKLRNSRIKQITCTLYMFNTTVLNKEIIKDVKKEINKLFFKGIIKNKEYYNNNELLKSVYDYFRNIIEKYYSIKKYLTDHNLT